MALFFCNQKGDGIMKQKITKKTDISKVKNLTKTAVEKGEELIIQCLPELTEAFVYSTTKFLQENHFNIVKKTPSGSKRFFCVAGGALTIGAIGLRFAGPVGMGLGVLLGAKAGDFISTITIEI